MSRSPRLRTVGSVLAAALAGALVLGGCGAGQLAPTAQQIGNSGGADATTGELLVRSAAIAFDGPVGAPRAYRAGSDAPLAMSIVNTGVEADRIVSASSTVASSVLVAGTTEVPGGQVLVVDGTVPAASEDAEDTGDADGADADVTAMPTATPTPAGERTVHIVLTGLRDELRVGMSYEVVLVFERAGEVRFDVPVNTPAEPRENEPAEE